MPFHWRVHLLLMSSAETTGFMRFCNGSVVFVFSVGVVLSVCLGCFLPGSLSHRAARSAGLDNQLSAEAGGEVHNVLPAQLWQERLLQGQAGESFSRVQWKEAPVLGPHFGGVFLFFFIHASSPFSPLLPQCESSLVGPPARCWCVSSWNGKKIPGSSDLLGDSDCHQEVTHWGMDSVMYCYTHTHTGPHKHLS